MVTSKTIGNGILRAVAIIAIVYLCFMFLLQIQNVIIYLVISLVLTLIGVPLMKFLRRRLKFNNIFATIATMFVFVLVIFGFIMMFVPLIISQGQNLSVLNTNQIEQSVMQLINQFTSWLQGHNIDGAQILKQSNFSSKLNFSFIPDLINAILGTLSSFGMGLASVLFITFFFLKDRAMFTNGAKKILPQSHEDQILNSVDKINHLLSRYFIGLLIQLTVVFILYLIVLLIFGVDNALVIALICALLNIIPYIGPLIASVFAAILTMISNLGGDFSTEILPTTIYVMIGFWIVQIIDNNFSQPLIFSNSVNSHPLEIFLVILIAGFMSGIMGMIIAVPLYTIAKVIAKEFFPKNKVVRILTKNI